MMGSLRLTHPTETLNCALLTYLRLSNKHLGLIINFHVEVLRDGIFRVVNKLQ